MITLSKVSEFDYFSPALNLHACSYSERSLYLVQLLSAWRKADLSTPGPGEWRVMLNTPTFILPEEELR